MTRKSSRGLVMVKLGGSLLTDKAGDRLLRGDVLARLAEEVASTFPELQEKRCGLILGHGSGSFGHRAAVEVGYEPAGRERRPAAGGSIVRRAALELHQHLLAAMVDAGLPALSFPPAGFLVASSGRFSASSQSATAPIVAALDQGFLPVVFGDVIVDSAWGYSIASTEEVFLQLVRMLPAEVKPRVVLWFGETDGLLDADGETIPRLTADEELPQVGRARGSDVTGGMALRLKTTFELARMGVPSRLLNGLELGGVRNALLVSGSMDAPAAAGTWVIAASPVASGESREVVP